MKFRKKPVAIEAVRVSDIIEAARFAGHLHLSSLPSWVAEAYDGRKLAVFQEGITIPTPEGLMSAEPTDWLIQGVKGELYPCKPDIFEATYESAEASPNEHPCTDCNGSGRVKLVDLGDGILLTPDQAKSRREADERISQAAREALTRKGEEE